MTSTYQKPADIDSRRIRVSLIDVPEEYEPEDSLVEDDTLRRSIEKSGVQQSIHVLPAARGRFSVVDGARRVLISRLLDLEDIPAVVHDGETDPGKLRFILNQLRQDLLPTQRAGLIAQLQQSFKMSQKDVAQYLGVNEGTISNWLSVLEYVPEIQRAIDTGELSPFHARSFDGMVHEGQRAVFKKLRDKFAEMPGKVMHQLVRKQFGPDTHPRFYVAPEKTLEKLSRKQGRRKASHRPKLSKDDKDRLGRDLRLKEVELADSKQELAQLKREIALAAPVVHAIMRSDELVALLPDEIGEEFTRFVEVY